MFSAINNILSTMKVEHWYGPYGDYGLLRQCSVLSIIFYLLCKWNIGMNHMVILVY